MSYVVTYDVFCDGAECSQWNEAQTRTKMQARKQAERDGWLVKGMKHYCPFCKASHTTESKDAGSL